MYEFNPGALDALGEGGTDGRDSREIRRTSSGLILRRIRISHRNALGQVVTTRINAAQEKAWADTGNKSEWPMNERGTRWISGYPCNGAI